MKPRGTSLVVVYVHVIQQRWWAVGRITMDQNQCSCSLCGGEVPVGDTSDDHVGRSPDIKLPVDEVSTILVNLQLMRSL